MKINSIYISIVALVVAACATIPTSVFAGARDLGVAHHFRQSRAALEAFHFLCLTEKVTGEELLAAAKNFSKLFGEGLGRSLADHEELVGNGATPQQLATHIENIRRAYQSYLNVSHTSIPMRIASKLHDTDEKTQIRAINRHGLAFLSVAILGLYGAKVALENGHIELAGASFVGVFVGELAVFAKSLLSQVRFRKAKNAKIEAITAEQLAPAFMEGLLSEYPFTGDYTQFAYVLHENHCELQLKAAPVSN